jgi:hypothetical protein
MKKLILATAAAIALMAAPAFAGATEKATGCATKPVQGGGNYTNFVDPNCLTSKSDGSNLLLGGVADLDNDPSTPSTGVVKTGITNPPSVIISLD